MSFKQRNYIVNLLTYKIISKNYSDYAGYINKLLQCDSGITVKQAGCIIDTLKNMVELNETVQKGSGNGEDGIEEIAEEKIE